MKDHKPENYENIHKYLFKCAIFHLITMSFFKLFSIGVYFSEQFTQELGFFFFPPSDLFCFYSFLQITGEEAKVLFFRKKLHSLQL